MASFARYSQLLASLFFAAARAASAAADGSCCRRVFTFGDSIIDTGNLDNIVRESNSSAFLPADHLPYGETFFHRPTGRYSDGRLIIDFITEALGLPFQLPYTAGKVASDFQYGANFAVAGATALSLEFYKKLGLDVSSIPPFPLSVQIEWFENVLRLIAPTEQERTAVLSSSLFYFGEIGDNDYNYPFYQNRTYDEVEALIPLVINTSATYLEELLKMGAKNVVVPGLFPLGCRPAYLNLFLQSVNKSAGVYNSDGCLLRFNRFSRIHNQLLVARLAELRRRYPRVDLVYADYYHAVNEIITAPQQHGFDEGVILDACCGLGGAYNARELLGCGVPGSTVCGDPSKYVWWDGQHFTEAAYHFVAGGLLDGLYAKPPILRICSSPA